MGVDNLREDAGDLMKNGVAFITKGAAEYTGGNHHDDKSEEFIRTYHGIDS